MRLQFLIGSILGCFSPLANRPTKSNATRTASATSRKGMPRATQRFRTVAGAARMSERNTDPADFSGALTWRAIASTPDADRARLAWKKPTRAPHDRHVARIAALRSEGRSCAPLRIATKEPPRVAQRFRTVARIASAPDAVRARLAWKKSTRARARHREVARIASAVDAVRARCA